MAYINQESKAKIATAMKPILKKYGVKGTLSVHNHSSISLNVKSGEIDFIKNFNDVVDESPCARRVEPAKNSLDVNPYWYQEHFSGDAKLFLKEAIDALKSADWFDDSDIQTDYFHTAYYFGIKIGKWNKPYILEL